MNRFAYNAGRRAALAKFGGASEAGPDGASSYASSGSPVATTHLRDTAQNITQGFAANAALGQTSSFTDPGFRNHTMQGGTAMKAFTSDSTGGLA